ncbi:MAG: hypothetical protein N3A69_10300 [Leptospiraceae bacterium]|nr:hypothetical protein [Leptospiraceae bacterium]
MLKNLFLFWGIMGFVYCAGESSQFTGNVELITSRYTEFYLVQQPESSTRRLLNSNYEPIGSIYSSDFNFYQSFQLGDEDILIFLTENSPENCIKFFVIGVQKGGRFVVTPEFGNCSDTPEIKQNSEKIEFIFPMTNNAFSQTVVYKDQKIEVTEKKVSKK